MVYNIITVYLTNYFLLEMQQNYMSVDLSEILFVCVSIRKLSLFNEEMDVKNKN